MSRAKTRLQQNRKQNIENSKSHRHKSQSTKKGAKKNKEKEYNPWAPKPIKPMEPIKDEFIVLEGNLLTPEILGKTNSEIVIKESDQSHCLLLVYNSPFPSEETLGILEKASSHIKDRKIRYSPDIQCYIIECAY